MFFPVVFFDINTDNELGIFRKNTLRDDDFYDLEVNFTDSLAVGRAGIGLSTMSAVSFQRDIVTHKPTIYQISIFLHDFQIFYFII